MKSELKKYILALLLIKGIGKQTIFNIINYCNNNNIIIKDSIFLYSLLKKTREEKIISRIPSVSLFEINEAIIKADSIINEHKEKGIGIISYYDNIFPSQLRNTINKDGKIDAPILLYYKGNIKLISKKSITIIGTRNPTEEGYIAANYLGQIFAQKKFNIISGLALGCDTEAHKGALKIPYGKTIAILAHGLDTIYPKKNKILAEEIVSNNGLLLSEYPLYTNVNRYNLVNRDRLQAALGLATIVIQTSETGGTNHAANITLKLKKPLFCVRYKDKTLLERNNLLGNSILIKKGADEITSKNAINKINIAIKKYNL